MIRKAERRRKNILSTMGAIKTKGAKIRSREE
jgi:hypothetical protein